MQIAASDNKQKQTEHSEEEFIEKTRNMSM
jgi:hypothetical protein